MKTFSKIRSFLLLLLGSALCLSILQGCGGGASSPEATAATYASGTASMPIPGAGSKYATFGKEASKPEREAANEVVQENFKARAAAQFSKQCKTLSAPAIKHVEEEIAFLGAPEGCVAALKTAAEPLKESAKARANNLGGPIAALRVKNGRAFALYVAKDGKPTAIPLRKESGKWKIDSLVSIDIPAEGSSKGA